MNVNQAAFCTSMTLAVITTASVCAAVMTTAGTVAVVAYSVLALVGAGVSIASMTAWLDKDSTTASKYFENLKSHSAIAIVGVFQFVTQILVQALIKGVADGVSRKISRKMA